MRWKLALALAGWSTVALAQEDPSPAPKAPVVPTHQEGEYGGAVPGSAQREKQKISRAPNTLTWVGFQKNGDTPRVFLRVTTSPAAEQSLAGSELVVRLPGFRLDGKNNGRPLNTKFFATDITRVRAVPVKGGLDLHVTFAKNAHEAKVSSEPAPEADGGGQFVYLDF